MKISNTYIEVIAALISLGSCIIAVISARSAWKNSRETEFYHRKDILIKIRDEILGMKRLSDYNSEFTDRLSQLTHNYVDELDDICKRFPYEMIIDSDIKNDLDDIKDNPDDYGDISKSYYLKNTLDKLTDHHP